MTRYRQTMKITIDVLANSVSEATDIIGEEYEHWDSALLWNPDTTVEVPEDDEDFFPINEEW